MNTLTKYVTVLLAVTVMAALTVTAQAGSTSSPQAGVPLYTLTPLGTLWGGYSQAYGISDKGEVVGIVASSAFRWSHEDGLQRLAVSSCAYAVNESGLAVGWSDTHSGRRAVAWNQNTMTDLGWGYRSWANATNDSGDIVGRGGTQAFLRHSGVTVDLGSGIAYDINNSGTVVGWSGGSTSLATVWFSPSNLQVIGGLPGSHESLAQAINNQGQVVGWCTFPGENPWSRAFLWTRDNGFTDLGAPPGSMRVEAVDINDAGSVVGVVEYDTGPSAFLWTPELGMLDINNLLDEESKDWTLRRAYGINNLGQIVGYGVNSSVVYAFLLTPIPEPSTLLALLCGLGGLALHKRRTR